MTNHLGRITAVEVMRVVAEAYGTSVEAIRSANRSKEYTTPRFAAIHCVLAVCPHLSLPMIGGAFGRRDHTTIMNGRDRAKELIKDDKQFASVVEHTIVAFSPRVAERLSRKLLHEVRNSKEAQAVYREANAAGVGDDVARKVRMGSAFA